MRGGQREPIYNFLGSMIIFHAAIQLITISLSLLRIQLDFPCPQLIILAALGAAYGFWRSGKCPADVSNDLAKPLTWPPDIIILSAVLTFVLLCVVGYFSDELSNDGNYYHLPAIYFWSAKGYVHWVDDNLPHSMFINGFPKAIELTDYVITHAFRCDAIVNAINMLFYPLGVFGLAYLARALGASRPLAWFAGAAWLLIPINIFEAPTLLIDCSFASCVIALIAVMVHAAVNFQPSSLRSNFRSMLIFGAAGGLVVGGKSTGIMIAGLGFLALTFCLAWRWARERASGIFTSVVLPMIFASAVLAAVGGYWNLRNYLYKGSPFYPAGVSVGNYRIFPGLDVDQFVQSEANTAPELRGQPVYKRVLKVWIQRWGWKDDFFWCDCRVGGLGYFWPAACLPAIPGLLIFLIHKRQWNTLGILMLMLSVTGAAFLLQPVNWWSRYTVWIYALGLPSFAAFASVFYRQSPPTAAPDAIDSNGNKPVLQRKPLGFWIISGTINIWASTCILILVLEGWVCCFWTCTWVKFPSPNAIKDSMITRFSPNTILWSNLHGTMFDDIFASNCPLALSHIYGHPNTNSTIIMGGLSKANGKRRIVMVDKNPDKKIIDGLLADGVKYLIWDSTDPLPEVLKQYDFPIEKAEVFYVVKLAPGEGTIGAGGKK